jgi:hypothetical protein
MKRSLIASSILLLLWLVPGLSAQVFIGGKSFIGGKAFIGASTAVPTPTFVQGVSTSNSEGATYVDTCFYFNLPMPAQSGNTIVIEGTAAADVTLTVTDNEGDSYTTTNYYQSITNFGQSFFIARSIGVTAGAQYLTACISAESYFVEFAAQEYANVTAFDVASVGNGAASGTAVTAGSGTSTANGDLVVAATYSFNENSLTKATTIVPGTNSGITWSLADENLDGFGVMYGVQTSSGALNPAITLGTSNPWVALAIFLKAGSSGSIPTGFRIIHLEHENLSGGGAAGPAVSYPLTMQFACSGNLLVGMWAGTGSQYPTGYTDSNSNTWAQAGSTYVSTGSDQVMAFYGTKSGGASCSNNMTLTMSVTGSAQPATLLLYDVAGAATSSVLDTTAGGVGNNSTYGNGTINTDSSSSSSGGCTTCQTLTPATANELILTVMAWDYNTATNVSPGLYDMNTFSGMASSGPNQAIDENNGWGHYFDPNTSTISGVTWTQGNAFASDTWACIMVALK